MTRPLATIPIALLALALPSLAGCDWSDHDMGKQASVRTYRPDAYFADGAGARPAVPGTIARDDDAVPGIPFAVTHPEPGGATPRDLPIDVTPEAIAAGQQMYTVTCSVCHGRLGNGDGMIVQRGAVRPPSFHVERLRAAPDAHFFDVITQGYGAMYSYNDRVTPQARWEIVAYIRALQTAGATPTVAAADRAALVAAGDPNAPIGGTR